LRIQILSHRADACHSRLPLHELLVQVLLQREIINNNDNDDDDDDNDDDDENDNDKNHMSRTTHKEESAKGPHIATHQWHNRQRTCNV